jgi:hypothetical protein
MSAVPVKVGRSGNATTAARGFLAGGQNNTVHADLVMM